MYGSADEFSKFAPRANDTVRELRWKAESALEYLLENQSVLRQFPTNAWEERLALWQPLVELLAKAMEDPSLADDACIEAQRVWAEETRHSALMIISLCVYGRTAAAQERFQDDPVQLDELIEKLESDRPAALRVLSQDDRAELRRKGFLREDE
jgi:hypothetical protein